MYKSIINAEIFISNDNQVDNIAKIIKAINDLELNDEKSNNFNNSKKKEDEEFNN